MTEVYDYVICGTGLKECILSGLLSVAGNKVFHIDRNDFYGGDCASLNLRNLFQKFGRGEPPESYGQNRNWNVDLIPKFIMANGQLVKILVKTNVKDYLDFRSVNGCYVYQPQEAGWIMSARNFHKVPATEVEALGSTLIPLVEKINGKRFFGLIARWKTEDRSTWDLVDPSKHTMADVFMLYGLSANIQDFVGHAIGLQHNDDYLQMPAVKTLEKLKLYVFSLARYGQSPFIYPVYGLTTLPEGFSRLCAVNGGTFMLRAMISGIQKGENGELTVELNDGPSIQARRIIMDPSYTHLVPGPSRITQTGKIVRAINILSNPVPETDNCDSCQIILPQKQLGRSHDIYIAVLGSDLEICLRGKSVAIVSTVIETDDALKEIEPALQLLGQIEYQFVYEQPIYVPDNSRNDGIIVTASYDASSHFEEATEEVIRLWELCTGTPLDLP